MNILINFRYLSIGKCNEQIFRKITDSREITNIIEDFKEYSFKVKEFFDLENKFVEINGEVSGDYIKSTTDVVKSDIEHICNSRLDEFNNRLEMDSFLFLDEICTIVIKRGKAFPLEDPEEYVNFSDVKRVTEEALATIAGIDEDFNLSSYSDILYIVYIDIVEKGRPIIII